MARSRTHYLCRTCGSVQSQWMGKCPDCGTWDALEKFTEAKISEQTASPVTAAWTGDVDARGGMATAAQPLGQIERTDVERLATGVGELDRVLGGGFVPASVVLLGGDPGIGKSTLLLQAAARMASAATPVLYVTSEESAYQVRLRSERLLDDTGHDVDADFLFVLADTNLARIIEQARKIRPRLMIVDSIQMVYRGDLDAAPGSVTQLRRCCVDLVQLAKLSGMAIALVGHVTKDGVIAGPKLLEHLVDAVLSFEGDRYHAHRVVRGIKNRFGTTLEVGLFEMTGHGLAELREASVLHDPDEPPRPGSTVAPIVHGSRALLIEIQALTSPGFLGNAKRKTSGLDGSRLAMLIAVLEKHGGLRLADQDVFASVVGGLRIIEPAADLAICLAIAGAHLNRALPHGVAAIGEVGLGGEIRRVPQLEHRLGECGRLGYRSVIMGRQDERPGAGGVPARVEARTIHEAMEQLQPAEAPTAAGQSGADPPRGGGPGG